MDQSVCRKRKYSGSHVTFNPSHDNFSSSIRDEIWKKMAADICEFTKRSSTGNIDSSHIMLDCIRRCTGYAHIILHGTILDEKLVIDLLEGSFRKKYNIELQPHHERLMCHVLRLNE